MAGGAALGSGMDVVGKARRQAGFSRPGHEGRDLVVTGATAHVAQRGLAVRDALHVVTVGAAEFVDPVAVLDV
jgi:hypothetical protein